MREIEVKVRVKDMATVMTRLAQLRIAVSHPVRQQDAVFGLPGEDGNDDNTAPWLRIRTESSQVGERTVFTLKKSITGQLDSLEHEVEVSSASELENIIEQLGFVSYSHIDKTRRTALFEDLEICIDTVESLGDFLEVEKLTDEDADYDLVVAEIWQLLDSLGFTHADAVTDGYDVLVNKL